MARVLRKVLLADDVELFLELEKTFLQREEITILVARNGREALETVRRDRPDLALLDLYMPEMNGDAVCRAIKEDPELRATVVVMVTSAGREEEHRLCTEAGCDEILHKPINRHLLLQTVRERLQVKAREMPRVAARVAISYGQSPERPLRDYTVNVSTGGVFIETPHLLPVDTPLHVSFALPDREAEIGCRARVAWVNHPQDMIKPALPLGMGLQFLDLPLEDRRAILEYVKQKLLSPRW